MPTLRRKRPRLLLVSMYPLDQGRWGPTVRISHLRDELAGLVDLDVVVRTSRRSSLGVSYSGDLLESLEPELESHGVRSHQVTSRLEWVPSGGVRVRSS